MKHMCVHVRMYVCGHVSASMALHLSFGDRVSHQTLSSLRARLGSKIEEPPVSPLLPNVRVRDRPTALDVGVLNSG